LIENRVCEISRRWLIVASRRLLSTAVTSSQSLLTVRMAPKQATLGYVKSSQTTLGSVEVNAACNVIRIHSDISPNLGSSLANQTVLPHLLSNLSWLSPQSHWTSQRSQDLMTIKKMMPAWRLQQMRIRKLKGRKTLKDSRMGRV
jgi:hypothetical protein